MAEHTATGRFDVTITPGTAQVDRTAQFELRKTWTGDLAGVGHGVMLSAGDPSTGSAGYVAIENVEGTLGGRAGGFVLLQQGVMTDADPGLTCVVAPGSGHGELSGITGGVELSVEDGEHRYVLTYRLPD